jgi:hypothetical protein
VRVNVIRANRFQEAEAALEEIESDPLAVHIFVSRRQYRNMPDTKSGKRRRVSLAFAALLENGKS